MHSPDRTPRNFIPVYTPPDLVPAELPPTPSWNGADNDGSCNPGADGVATRNDCDWSLPGIWGLHGGSCRNDADMAWNAPRRSMGLNPPAYNQLAPAGHVVGPLFLLLSATLAFAAVGWFKRRLWGWRLAVGIISTQVAGDLVNLIRGDLLRGAMGFAIAGTLLIYLFRPRVRATFR